MRRLVFSCVIAAMIAAVLSGMIVVATARAGRGCPQPLTDERGTSVDLKQACMSPTVLRVDAGQTVTFTNRDQISHTVTGAGAGSGDGWGSYDELGEGDTFTMTFDANGVYPYFCVLHPSMVGAIVVGGGGGTPALAPGPTGDGSGRGGVLAASAGGAAAAGLALAFGYGIVAAIRARG